MKSPLEALPAQLGELMLRDQQRLRRRLQGARKIKNPDAQLAVAAEVESDIAAARQKCRCAPRLARALPIRKACRSAKKQDILNAIRDHQVVIVAGKPARGKPPSCRRSVWNWGAG